MRKALHVGDTEFTSIGRVYVNLIPDMMRSVKPQVDELLKEYRMMFYSGQLDLIVAYPLTHEGMFKDVAWGPRLAQLINRSKNKHSNKFNGLI